jgi:16S rRNA (cytidine1402-2'-O)-methyltransferase
MPGTLHVVATPIGNLDDITLRALRVLREVALIAAEDTRHSRKLLTHHGIHTPLVSYHEHNRRSRLPMLLDRLQAGQDVAVITDAGTPGVSDPGVDLVAGAISVGIAINPLPGPSAPVTAAMASGFPMVPLTFLGFAPHRSKDRIQWFRDAVQVSGTVCLFEAPTRIHDAIGQLAKLDGQRPIVIAREMTKLHQELIRGKTAELNEARVMARGEFTLVLGPAEKVDEPRDVPSDAEVADLYRTFVEEAGMTRRAAITATARASARSSRDVYAAIERAKAAAT